MIMPNSVWDISLLLGESDTYEPDYHTHDESICRQQAVLAEEDAHQARRNGSGTDFSEIVCECRTFRFHGFPRKMPENHPAGWFPAGLGVVAVAISGREQLLVHPSWWTSSPASVVGIAPEYADGVPKRLRYQEVLAKEQSHDRSG
ncbi:TPA: hypothetical protein ACRMAT_000838, partial [Pseudomonas aeruginosa]